MPLSTQWSFVAAIITIFAIRYCHMKLLVAETRPDPTKTLQRPRNNNVRSSFLFNGGEETPTIDYRIYWSIFFNDYCGNLQVMTDVARALGLTGWASWPTLWGNQTLQQELLR